MPYVQRAPRRHASRRRIKRRFLRGVLFLVVIVAATYALNFFFGISQYSPTNAPTSAEDQTRDLLMKKLQEAEKSGKTVPTQAPTPSKKR